MRDPFHKLNIVLLSAIVFCLTASLAWSDKPTPTWNGKPVDQMTAQEVKAANKELNDMIKKGDSSAVQQKADLNNAFDKTPQGQRAKKEDQLAKNQEELEILKKKAKAMGDKEWDLVLQGSSLRETGNYWNPGHSYGDPPDGNIGPGGDRDRMADKLKREQEKARKAREEAQKAIKDLEDKIRKLQDELYVKSGDTQRMPAPAPGPAMSPGPPTGWGGGDFQLPSPPWDSSVNQKPPIGQEVSPEFHWPEPSLEDFGAQREIYNEPVTSEASTGSTTTEQATKKEECPTPAPNQTQ